MINEQPKEPYKTNPSEKRAVVMSAQAFAQFGVGHLAYIKPVVVDGQPVAAIFAADGQQIGLTETADVARAAAVQHSLEPVSVH